MSVIEAPGGTGFRLDRLAPAFVVALMLAFFAQGFFAAGHKSLTWDEPTTLGGGYATLAWGDYDVYLESPPLMQVLSAWGLYRASPTEPEPSAWQDAVNPKVQLGVLLLFSGETDFRAITRSARLPVLVIGTLLVGLVFLWGRALLGTGPALAAATLVAFAPNLLAHAQLATADMGVTALMVAAVAAFWWAVQRRGWEWWALCGLVTGLALIAKFTGLLLGPTYVLLVAGLWVTRPETRSVAWVAKAAVPIALLSWLVIALAYGFDPDLSLYRDGVARLYSDHSPEHRNYLLGMSQVEPFWYYTLIAYVIKAPTAVLVLLVIAAVRTGARLRTDAGPGELETALFLLVPVLVVFAASFFDQANIGLRRVLPALPFLLLFGASAFREVVTRSLRVGLGALLAAAVVAGISIYPHHLAFFNQIAGGPANAPFLLDDSNIDWGQDLPALAEWQRSRPEDEVPRILYFGTAHGPAYGIRGENFDERDRVAPRPGVYAMSVHHLVGFRKLIAAGQPALDWLTEFEPSARLGYSIYIYEFE